jgi:hypothetical protein
MAFACELMDDLVLAADGYRYVCTNQVRVLSVGCSRRGESDNLGFWPQVHTNAAKTCANTTHQFGGAQHSEF